MEDFLYVPGSLIPQLLDEITSWEDVQGVSTLLTIACLRAPVTANDEYSTYIVKASEVRSRVCGNTDWGKFGFSFRGKHIPFISNFKWQKVRAGFYMYDVHELAHPRHYEGRYYKICEFDEFPVILWKLSRHVLVRWRYASRLPLHLSNFNLSQVGFDDKKSVAGFKTLSDAISMFDYISKMFHHVMGLCDRSTLSYAFVCTVYFYAHDFLIKLARRKETWLLDETHSFFIFLENLRLCFEKVCYRSDPPQKKIFVLEGFLRKILPNGAFNARPMSLFSASNYTKQKN